MKICLVFEGSYPYIYGGVSSWADQLIRSLPDVSFSLLLINPKAEKRGQYVYELPENVNEVVEYFLDEPLSVRPSFRYRFSFTPEEVDQIKRMLLCRDCNFDVIIDAFRRQKYPAPAFLESREFITIFNEIMDDALRMAPYSETFYQERSMMVPVLYLLNAKVPEADCYHSISTGYAGLLSVVAGRVTGKPILLTEHGIYSREREEELVRSDWVDADYKRHWIDFFYMLSNAIYKKAVRITSLFDGASAIQADIGAPADRLQVIRNGIDYGRFSGAPAKKGDGWIDIGAVVRFAKIKDIKSMIYAVYEVLQSMPNVRLHILGPDEDEQYAKECRDLISYLGLENNVLTPGWVSDMPAYYRKLDFTILTSLSEGQPLTILESFAAGRPCVATDVGCCRELVYGGAGDSFGPAGYIAHPMDPHDIATKILLLARNPQDIVTFGENGRKRAAAYYQRPEMVESYRRLYEFAVTRTGGKSGES